MDNNNTVSSANIVVGSVITIFSTLNFIINGFGFFIVKNNPVLANSFGRLCLNQCFANCANGIILILWVAPLTFTQGEAVSTSILGRFVGLIMSNFWGVFIFSHVAVSLDRLIAIRFPLQSKQFFTRRNSKICSLIPWCLALVNTAPFFWYESCFYVYDPNTWRWSYGEDTHCNHVLSSFNMYKNMVLVGIMTVLDLTTLYYFRRHNQFMKRMSTHSDSNAQLDQRHRKTEARFILQTVVQGSIVLLHQINLHVIIKASHEPWFLFLCTTFSIMLAHVLDGLILCAFQVNSYVKQRKTAGSSQRSGATPRDYHKSTFPS